MARPPFVPTDDQRKLVCFLAGEGVRHTEIAPLVKNRHGRSISLRTLTRHFPEELHHGKVIATVKVAAALFRAATEGKDVMAAIFWLKCRAGWTVPKRRLEVVAPVRVIATCRGMDDIAREAIAEHRQAETAGTAP